MTKVTINPVAQAPEIEEEALPDNVVQDSKGRRLVIEDPDFLTESRIMRALGDASINTGYVLGYVMPAIRVVQIDDIKLPYPSTPQQIEAAIARLGREGTAAVLARDAANMEKARAAAASTSHEAEALKNS
ncbi:MAG: hypothetical protein PW999_10030 [Paraburkholderia tropica]|nr:hypothetical protein [Paraburkholderia tropica]